MVLNSLESLKKQKGFTLIELLFVIAIISLISSIVLVSLKGAMERARIAKGLSFSGSIHRALGAYAVGMWDFHRIEAGKVLDASGYGNHGTVYGATLVKGMPELGNALSFDGVDDYVEVPDSPSLNPSAEITISVWVRLNAIASDWAPISHKGDSPRTWWFGFFPGSATRIHWSNANLTHWALNFDIPSALNTWRMITVTYKNGVGRKGYVDGNLVASDNSSGTLPPSTASVVFARRPGAWSPINGLIDEVRIYSEALTSAQIESQYYAGLNNLLAKGLLTEQEHKQRLTPK